MITALGTTATIFGTLGATLLGFHHINLGLFFISISLGFLLCSLLISRNQTETGRHHEEKLELAKATLYVIDARGRITLELINDFKAIFNQNKFFVSKPTNRLITETISCLGDIRIDDEELKDRSLPQEERKSLVAHRRKCLDRLECIKPAIEKYIRRIT